MELRISLVLLLAAIAVSQPGTAATCEIVDAFAPALATAKATRALAQTGQLALFERDVIEPFASLYRADVIGIVAGPARDARIDASLAELRDSPAAGAAKQAVIDQITAIAAVFAASFPDFRCDFPVYLMDALGQLDGAGRVVAGRPALVIGVDMLAKEAPRDLPVFLAHEFFHRYHFRASGFSDDAGDGQALWRVLWAEGLATYASWKLTPGATVSDALLLPADLEQRARPKLAEIVRRLQPHLDKVDARTYRLLFTYGNKEAPASDLPWRSGYYAGFCVAAELGRTRSVDALAHLAGPALRSMIGDALSKLENASPTSGPCG